MSLEKDLKSLRDQIDGIDSALLKLLNDRVALAKEIGVIKEKHSEDSTVIYRPEREAQVVRRLTEENTGDLTAEQVNLLYREVMSICRGAEARLRVAVLGPEATFTEMAALQQFGSSVEIVYQSRIDQVFKAVETGNTDYGVVPVENSTEGVVSATADMLATTSLNIAGEIQLAIHQALLSQEASLASVKTIFSHTQSLSQCQVWLRENLPNAKVESVSSNAQAARLASESEHSGAIASERAAQTYNLNVLASHIEDNKENTTRFLVLSREQVAASGKDKTSLIMSCKNEPGSLFKLLKPLHDHGISMLKIESRPSKTKRWEYLFFVDVEGHQEDEELKLALSEVEEAAEYFRVLGAYPGAD